MVTEEKINLYYFDETGFTTTPSVPYAWQPRGSTHEIPSFPSKRFNVLGFMAPQHDAFFHTIDGSVTTAHVIEAFEQFTCRYATEYASHQKPCIVILDNASIHTSHAFLAKLDDWATRGVALYYLPTYSPELNLIEILWAKIKYQWLWL